jgi:hypothetical protein
VPNRIELASGEIAQDARISVELNPSEDRAACLIIWPRKPTAVSPAKLAGCVAGNLPRVEQCRARISRAAWPEGLVSPKLRWCTSPGLSSRAAPGAGARWPLRGWDNGGS